MRPTLRGFGILSVSVLSLLCGCGGGGGKNSPSQDANVNHPPVTTVPVWTPADKPMGQFASYAFTTTGTDPDIGNTVASYEWDFGDGSPRVVTSGPTASYAYPTAGTFTVQVRAVDNLGLAGAFAKATTTVAAAVNPFTVTIVSPAAASTLNVDLGKTVQANFAILVANSGTGTLSASGITLDPNDASAVVGPAVDGGKGLWTIPVTYPAATATGTRVVTPTVVLQDSLGLRSPALPFSAVTIKTLSGVNNLPTITVTRPTSASTAVFTKSPVSLDFTLLDGDGDPVTYTVNWKDGSKEESTTVNGDTAAGVPVSLSHAFPDSFAGDAAVSITATDSRSGAAAPKSVTFKVTFNAYPTATITSPQASATIPPAVAALAIPASDPAVVVLPINGKVAFLGNATLPGSQEGSLKYNWTFEGGVPSSSTDLAPGEVSFQGNPGEVVAHKVTFTVTDTFGRVSKGDPTQATPAATQQAFQRTYQRWVVVDGSDSQNLTLSFLFRQRSGTGAADLFSYAQNAVHGFGAAVRIFQDGITNSYVVAAGNGATTQIPVRSDVPFWLSVPASIAGDTADGSSYMFSIPNKHGLDPDLEGTGQPRTLTLDEGTAFAFRSASYPWNPQLQITTGGGFGTENLAAGQRRFLGNTDLFNNVCLAGGIRTYEPNLRWIDRLSVPTTDALPSQPFTFGSEIAGFSGIAGYQSIPEWFIFLKAMETRDWNSLLPASNISGFSTASSPADLGFVVDDAFLAPGRSSQHWAVSAMQAFRAPASASDPYDFDVMKSNIAVLGSTDLNDGNMDASLGLNPTPVAPAGLAFLSGLVNSVPSGPLTGGASVVSVPYDSNSTERLPNNPQFYDAFHNKVSFAYAEYLWTKAWARPLVINRTNLNFSDTRNGGNMFTSYPQGQSAPVECGSGLEIIDTPLFFYSNPSGRWPYASHVSPTNSAYDLNVTNGGTFNASSPVTEGGSIGTTQGVGRFFWTAFAPQFNASPGALLSRTWLAASNKQIPTTFSADVHDATTAWGFLPPQDTLVDKRARNLDGTPAVPTALGGYRITWFNPTKDSTGMPVAPDFWAVQMVSNGSTQMFLLSGNYPRVAGSQSMNDTLVTDAREFIPSHQATYQTGDLAGPGSCWFDVPVELRPASDATTTITVFALKSILKNNAVPGARILNRSEWVEAVKTVTANINTRPGGQDVRFAHKIPFNYPWDIVVVNGPATSVSR